jgi:hypothetical protein
MSSWSEVLDEHLMQTNHIEGSMIIGQDGHCWAKTNPFSKLFTEENEEYVPSRLLTAVLDAFNDPSNLLEYGFVLLNDHYTITQYGDNVLFAKKGFNGLIIVKTNQTIVFAVYNMHHQPSEAVLAVEKFANYLHSQEL